MKQSCLVIAGVLAIVLVLVAPVGAETLGGVVVDNDGDVGQYTSIALDSLGHPHISYYDNSNSDLKYASWNGTAWATTIVDNDGYVGKYTSIALDSLGHPHISYRDCSNGYLKYASWNGTAWETTTVDSSHNTYDTSLALDSLGHPHIGYFDDSNGELRYATLNGTAWKTTTVDKVGGGWYASLALDSLEHPHISYYNVYTHDLMYASLDGTAWTTTIVDGDGSVGGYASLAFDTLGYPHISYRDFSNNALKYASWNSTAWTTTTVDSVGSGDYTEEGYTSLALDASGHPHISYYDHSNDALKYASWDGTAWDITTVDSDGNVGEYTSLALDTSGHPHISYYDHSNGDLKYAKVWSAPVPGFTGFPTSGPAPLTVNFTDTSTNDPTRWFWNFGSWSAVDGGVSTLKNPSHTYDTPGTYSVSLGAQNPDGGDTVARTGYITVTEPVLKSGFMGFPTNGTAPLTVVFNDTSTGEPTAWSWFFGDGGVSTEENPTHTYTTPGEYNVTLTVSDAEDSDSLTKPGYITVSIPPFMKYDIPLSAGWNMVSVPVTDPTLTLPDEMICTVYWYDVANMTYAKAASLSALAPGVGYWMSATDACTLSVNGSYMDAYQANLCSGWNMIGSVCGNASFTDPETDPAGSVHNSVYGYSPALQTYVTTTTLVPGEGYWASATQECLLNVSA